MTSLFKGSPYRRPRDVETGGGRTSDLDNDSGDEESSSTFYIPSTKNASVDRLRRWRQAALVLNASRRFRYTLDLKKEEEKKQILRKIRAHAQAIRAAYLFKEAGQRVNGVLVFPFEVLQQATGNFSEEKILGKGNFSVVYEGKLDQGTEIAVKRMKDTTEMNDLNKEIAVLQEVSHRHLVAFLGSCINDNEKLLVYEYMPQGTLAQHLFESSEQRYPVLTWNQRITIVMDVARGVEYLHGLTPQGFIHRDLKPSNILLGDDMRAKVADFGLIKLAPEGNHSTQTRVAGTPGYIAPEYASTGKATKKVDVYAFGVILLEIITGRKALDYTLPSERHHLVTYFQKDIINKKKLQEAIDETLNPDKDTLVSIWKVAELARRCTFNERSERPDIGYVVNSLGRLVDQGKRSRRGEEDTSGINLNTCPPQFLQRWQADEGKCFNPLSIMKKQVVNLRGWVCCRRKRVGDTLNSTAFPSPRPSE